MDKKSTLQRLIGGDAVYHFEYIGQMHLDALWFENWFPKCLLSSPPRILPICFALLTLWFVPCRSHAMWTAWNSYVECSIYLSHFSDFCENHPNMFYLYYSRKRISCLVWDSKLFQVHKWRLILLMFMLLISLVGVWFMNLHLPAWKNLV